MGSIDALLTRLEITPHGELYAGFRGIGGIYFPWKHLFATRILGRSKERKAAQKKAEAIREQIETNPKLKNFPRRLKRKYWWIFQLYCGIGLKDELPEEFIRGHYTQQARWLLANPGNYVNVDDAVLDALEKRKGIEQRIGLLRERIGEDRAGSYATRIFNELNKLFDEYDGSNFEAVVERAAGISSLKRLERDMLEERRRIADQIARDNDALTGKARLRYSAPNAKKKDIVLRVEQDSYEYLKQGRMIKAEDVVSRKWLFLDIEIPYFRRENPEITWVGASYVENGKKRNEIHTIHNLGVDEVNGFKVYVYKDADELVSKLAEAINIENPDFVSSYNTRFDLIKLREAGSGFLIGDEESNPLYRVTTPFFERIGIKDRLVADFLRWQKTARAYDINAKLEMAAGFRKEIDYDELESLEDRCFEGDKEAGMVSARYLTEDVTRLVGLFESDEFRRNLEDVCWMCERYGLGLERVLHSPSCANDVQEKGFFKALGIYREDVPPHEKTKRMQELRTKAKGCFKRNVVGRSVKEGEMFGVVENVYKVFIPVGDFFREIVAVSFPEIKDFYEYKDRFRGDKKRLFFLEQYAGAFSKWIVEDYGAYLTEVRRFDRLLKKVKWNEFEDAYHDFRRNIETESRWGLMHLDKGELSVKSLKKYIIPSVSGFLERNEISHEDFCEIANKRVMIKRRGRHILGNYNVFPDRRFFDPDKKGEDVLMIEDVLRKRFNEVNDFIELNGLEIVARGGNYLYLAGNKGALEREDAPVVLVDEIPRLYNADNPYYEKFGFFSHMKLKDEPDYHLTVHEMKAYREMLENLIEGRNSTAVEAYEKAVSLLESEKVGVEELLFFNKTKQRYAAYAKDCKNEDGRIYFVTDERFAPEEADILEDEEKRRYFADNERGKEIKVYIMGTDSVKPDFERYLERFKKRGKKILKPIAGKRFEDKQGLLFVND